MPGRIFLTRDRPEIAEFIGLRAEKMPPTVPRLNIAPGQDVFVWDGSALGLMRWGMIPVGRVNARGRPVMETIINARSETLFDKSAFSGVGRAIVPADGWYEWTGKTGRKQPWKICPADGGLLAFAAIADAWEAPGGRMIQQMAMVTCAPSADVEPYHHRMGVLLDRSDWDVWLKGDETQAAELCRPFPEGRLTVEPANDVDWDGA